MIGTDRLDRQFGPKACKELLTLQLSSAKSYGSSQTFHFLDLELLYEIVGPVMAALRTHVQ